MQKILVTTGIFPPSVGGPATYSKLLLDELPKRGIDVDVVSFDEVRFLPKFIRHLVFLFKLILRARSASIIYAQDTVSVGFPSVLASKILGKLFWLRVPGDYAWEQSRQRHQVKDSIDDFQNNKYGFRVEALRKVQRIVAKNADKIIVPSDYFKNLVSGWVSDPSKVHRIYNGIELFEIDRKKEKRNIIFSSGRLVPWKGFDVLIDSVLELRKKYPDIELRIAGDGPEREKLLSKSDDSVKILGFLSKDDIQKELSQASIYVLNTSFESFSFAIVEAMWAGVPVVATKVGNISEIIEDGRDGLLIEPNNKEDIISSIDKILSNPDFSQKISNEGKVRAKDFSIERTLDQVVNLIRDESNKY